MQQLLIGYHFKLFHGNHRQIQDFTSSEIRVEEDSVKITKEYIESYEKTKTEHILADFRKNRMVIDDVILTVVGVTRLEA